MLDTLRLTLKQLIKSCFSNQYKSQLEQPNIKPHNYQAVTYIGALSKTPPITTLGIFFIQEFWKAPLAIAAAVSTTRRRSCSYS